METQMLTPTPGGDYPRTWNEFLDWFATEEERDEAFENMARIESTLDVSQFSIFPLNAVAPLNTSLIFSTLEVSQ